MGQEDLWEGHQLESHLVIDICITICRYCMIKVHPQNLEPKGCLRLGIPE